MRLYCKIVLFLSISFWVSVSYAWAQRSARNTPTAVHYTYIVIAKRAAKQSIVLDGLQIKSFGFGTARGLGGSSNRFGEVFTLTDNGTLFFVADTDRGTALFKNQKALAYYGKAIGEGKFVDAGAATEGQVIDAIDEATGDIVYEMAYESDNHTKAVAVVNDAIVYEFQTMHGVGDAGFTKDGKYAIPIPVSFSSPNKWLIGGTPQETAPNGSVFGRAPINGIPDTRITPSLQHTDIYADELYQKELGTKTTTYMGKYHNKIGHVDILRAEYSNWHYKASRNHKGQIAILLSADDVNDLPASDPSNVAQVIILATPTRP